MRQDNTMSIQEAARFLEVTERTVRNYINKGLLSKTKVGRKVLLVPEEVVSLKEDMDSVAPIVSRQEMLHHRAKIRRLESHMEVVLRILDAKDDPLTLSEEYSAELYNLAGEQRKSGSWSVDQIKPWIEIFNRLSENDFEVMQKATKDLHPWRVFLKLCTSMMAQVVSDSEYVTSLELQGIHRLLAEARRRLRISAFIYGEMIGFSSPEVSAGYGDSLSESLFKKILKK